MELLLLAGLAGFLLFGFVVFFGPPFLPTLRPQAEAALDMLELKPGQTLLELGSGDGRVMLAAARRGYNVVGIELSPLLVLYSRLRCWRYRRQIKVIWGNYLTRGWPPADAVFTFALPRLMPRLDAKVNAWRRGAVLMASYAFEVPGKKPVKKQAGVFVYKYE